MPVKSAVTHAGSFDSYFDGPDRENCSTLRLVIRLHLNRMEPRFGMFHGRTRDSADIGFPYDDWPDNEWASFQRSVESICESMWSAHGFLLPPAHDQALIRSLTHPSAYGYAPSPFICCTLDVQVSDRRLGTHAEVKCYHLPAGVAFFRSFARDRVGRNLMKLSNRDVTRTHPGNPAYRVVSHELGHLLGLPHVLCDSNDEKCYGLPGTPERKAILGAGTNFTAHEVRPWIERMGQHTGTWAGWTPVFTHPVGRRGSDATLNDWLSTPMREKTLLDEMSDSPY